MVTSRIDLAPLALYNWYVRRGEPELWIKDLKDACFADRLSCHRFWANQFRLLLHAAAYWLLDALRRLLLQAGVARMQLDTLRLRPIKIGGWLREQAHMQRGQIQDGWCEHCSTHYEQRSTSTDTTLWLDVTGRWERVPLRVICIP